MMFQHGFVPQELPDNFPRAIHWVLLTAHPSSRQCLINVAVQSAMVSLALQELMFLAMVLRQSVTNVTPTGVRTCREGRNEKPSPAGRLTTCLLHVGWTSDWHECETRVE